MAYFKTVEYGSGVYALWETLGVGSFLIVGNEKALLIDTGYGFGDIAAAVRAITDKPLIVANSHVHPDHSMGNDRFPRVLIGAGDMDKLQGDVLNREFDAMVGFATKYLPPLKLLVNHYGKLGKGRVFRTEYAPITTGDVIELGGRAIEVYEMPGHTPGSVVFSDRATKTVFAGDAVNRGMFLFLNKSVKLNEYAVRLDGLAKLRGFETILSSHSKKPVPFTFVKYYADFLRRVDVSKIKTSPMPLSEGKAARYSEKSRDYGSVSVFFNLGQEG